MNNTLKQEYITPQVEIMTARVERGFQSSTSDSKLLNGIEQRQQSQSSWGNAQFN